MTILLACVLGPGSTSLPAADSGDFYDGVEAELGTSCANPACHGTDERPLQVYAAGLHRASSESTYLETPLSSEEHRLNFDRARAFLTPSDPSASPLLTKPLHPDTGGQLHGDSLVIYGDRTEPGWAELAAWAGAD